MTALTHLETLTKQLAIANAQKIVLENNYAINSDNLQKQIDHLTSQIADLQKTQDK